jgi:hypothetical protein
MKNVLTAILLMFVSVTTFPQNVQVDDYQVPISQARSLRFDGSWNWSQTGDTVTSNNGTGTFLYRQFYSSLPFAWFLNVDASGGKNLTIYNHNVKVDVSFQKYIFDDADWFGFTRVTGQHANNYKQIASDLTVGFGYGRYINATALAKAVRIEDHLWRDNVILLRLPKETLINIANIIERENEFVVIYGLSTYETYWFEAIENEILKTDALDETGVGSLGILRIRQVLFGINERVNERYYGWDVKTGILFPLTTLDKSAIGNPNMSISARYSWPINWELQLNSNAEVFTPMDSSFMKQYQVRAGVDFIYELSNRVNFVSGYRLGMIKLPNQPTLSSHDLNTSFWYYLENNIYLTITAGFTKQGDNPRVLKSFIGLQYNLI